MARPRKSTKAAKARVEGAEAPPIAADEHDHGVEVVEVPANPPWVEESVVPLVKLINPVPGDDGDALDRIAASFRERFPDEWDGLALCPLKHGIAEMANLMRGKG